MTGDQLELPFYRELTDEEKRWFAAANAALPTEEDQQHFGGPYREPGALADTGKRIEMGGGMVREPSDGRVNYLLALDGPMFDRYANHMTKGALKYSSRNWMKIANALPEERAAAQERYRESAFRHFVLWLENACVNSEDHAAAVIFNINAYEYLEEHR